MSKIYDAVADGIRNTSTRFNDDLGLGTIEGGLPVGNSYDELPFAEWNGVGPTDDYNNTRLGILDSISRSSGGGPHDEKIRTFMSGLDRFNHLSMPPNAVHYGYTFITRPRLCLTQSALDKNVEFVPLGTGTPDSLQFAIRCLLDTKFCNGEGEKLAESSKLIDTANPFLTPICNALTGISNFPDPVIDTVTTDSGFFSEDHTSAVGYDMLNKSYDLTLSFRDPQFGPIASLMYYWILYIGLVAKGYMPAYADDIQQLRLNYTVSIYRFLTDPTKQNIVAYAKATGCFPKSVPIGSMFDFSESQHFVSTAGDFSVPFTANKIEYNNPHIITDFNRLVERYHDHRVGGAEDLIRNKATLRPIAQNNYMGLPYITSPNENTPNDKLKIVYR